MTKLPTKKKLRNSNKNAGFKVTGIPREEKKLLIINVNFTLFDSLSSVDEFYGRPFLHIFLGKMYKYYDIGLWTSTTMERLEGHVSKLDIENHPDYKILFYADASVTVDVKMSHGLTVQVKPLDTIWKRFPQYNSTNTLLCDAMEDNFFFNPLNGILVEPYYYDLYKEDDEFLKLAPYLEWVAQFKDVTKINHKIWETRIVADSY
ncbi:hypothetical protein ILUMI_23068 [Ignelater luminosus]|uniref:FCP1 homology domain-containing protein n=1 Tax=Ignelater luminosus TaxID=2038154 RepID=A0A8K0G200_IGNLU|nr:hypothetical protein ILUMI_23068 [Ignelater luminosus]